MKRTLWMQAFFLMAVPAMVLAQSHSAVSPRFTVDTRDNVNQIVRPGAQAVVLAGSLAGGEAIPAIQFDFEGASVSYVVFKAEDESTTPSVKPANRTDVDLDLFRVDVSGTLLLNSSTSIRARRSGTWQTNQTWGVHNWRAARYSWTAYNASGTSVKSGSISLGKVFHVSGSQSGVQPVVLVHGIGATYSNTFVNSSTTDLGESLALARPAYAFEYPNTDDIPRSANLLGLALQRIATRHAASNMHAVAHSMGGVVCRYYKSFLGSLMDDRLDRVFTLGSPFEGAGIAQAASSDYFGGRLALGVLASGQDLEAALGAVDTPAVRQLQNPQTQLGLPANNSTGMANDSAWLAACGTRGELVFARAELEALQVSLDWRVHLLYAALLGLPEYLGTGSDGIVSWPSACKPPLSEAKNLYYNSSHITYFGSGNPDFGQMSTDARNFLSNGLPGVSSRLRARPATIVETVVLSVAAFGRTVGNAVIGYGDSMVRILGGVLDGNGGMACTIVRVLESQSAASSSAAPAPPPVGETIYVFSPGFLPEPVGTAFADGSFTIDTPDVELRPDTTWNKPRNTSVLINGGALSTVSATVQLSLAADSATEMAVFEPGGAVNWQAYGGGTVTRSFTFSSATPGEKTVFASFRNAQGEGPMAFARITLVQSGQTGALSVQDDAGGGAHILLDGRLLTNRTPTTVSGLATGIYSVALIKEGVEWEQPAQTATVQAGQTTTVQFRPFAATRVLGLAGDLAFGTVTAGQTAQRTLVVSNSGNRPLTVSDIVYPAGFSGLKNLTVNPGASVNVTVTFAPPSSGSFGGAITVVSDKTAGTGSILCSGAGAGVVSSFLETWESGTIRTDVWRKVGSPLPVVTQPGRASTYALDTEGDGNYDSGLVSLQEFEWAPGTTFRMWVRADSGSGGYHDVRMGICAIDPALVQESAWGAVEMLHWQYGNRTLNIEGAAGGYNQQSSDTWLPLGAWHLWEIVVGTNTLTYKINGNVFAVSPPVDLSRGRGALLISGRSGSPHFIDDVEVAAPTTAPPNNPYTPLLLSPADRATGLSLTPTLRASAYADPEGDAHANSRWIVYLPGQFSTPAWDSDRNAPAATETTVPAGRLLPATTYYWVARYKDAKGYWSDWSASRQFTTASLRPDAPSPVSPANGATGVGLAPTLRASAYSDPQGDAHANSQWLVYKDGGINSPAWDSGLSSPAGTQVAVPTGRLQAGTAYNWAVRYKDSQGNWSDWSAAWRFTTETLGPSPSGGIEVSTSRPTFTWPAVSGATWYHLWLNHNGKTYIAPWVEAATSWTPPAALPCGSYQWWVQGWGLSVGTTPWSQAASFSVPCQTPGALVQVAPSGAQSGREFAYRWQKDSRATWYRLWVGRTGAGTFHDGWYELSGTGEASVTLRGHPGGQYTWWLQGWGPDGFGPWSGPKAFSIPTKAPGAIPQIAPSGAQTETTLTYRWQKDGNATWYRLWSGRNGVTFHDRWYEMSGTGEAAVAVNSHPAGGMEWWIQGWGPDGFGPWSGPKAFSTPAVDPDKPLLISPSGTISNYRPTFRWNPAAGAEWYHVRLEERMSTLYGPREIWDGWTKSTSLGLPAGVALDRGFFYGWRVSAWNEGTRREISSDYMFFSAPEEF